MKTAQLPPVRVEPSIRAEIEGALHEGESLSQFVESAVLQAARRRKADQEFLARGRASLAEAKRTGEFYPVADVLDELQRRIDERMKPLRLAKQASAERP